MRSTQSAALSASAIVSAWNCAWLPNRLLIAPRVLPSSAATAFASIRENGPTAIERSSSSSESRLICCSATSSPISTYRCRASCLGSVERRGWWFLAMTRRECT